jgi:hypothetical protein
MRPATRNRVLDLEPRLDSAHTSGSAPLRVYSSVWQMPCETGRKVIELGLVEQLACVENLDSDLV